MTPPLSLALRNPSTELGLRYVAHSTHRSGELIPWQVLQKTGQIERTVDREFADEESKYRA